MKKQWNESTKKVRKSDMITLDDSKSRITLQSVGKFVQSKNWIHPARILDSYEFILVEEGTLWIAQEEQKYSIIANQYLLLQPGRNHYGTKELEGKLSFYWVHFTIENEGILLPTFLHGTLENPYVIANLLKQMMHSFYSLDYPVCYSELLLGQMLLEVHRMQEKALKNYRPILKEIGEWIRIHAEERISVKLVADVFQYNPDYLTKVFMETFQISIKDYIIQQKLVRAKYYLLHTNYTIKQIAANLHFDDSNTFLKYFKYHEKITPTEYRNLYFNTHLNQK
jgi:AraC-like DNA-binding protein|nr:AraC family transcriptional regulator [uncultured Lachnoclostridium sp.]